ncbi:5-carboxymethyl-2-hydroxymuconate isomerase [Amphritea atlantica]|uniref:5-carboxymethyl-2-hydroxymuconate isomerase n=1 Tax=Amphritea atlantica TaxID=355243 RepID=A0A1H9GC21_9GAMM|nr:5-carboxymethyl-2-hydroxymuconate Delta-isomerase [Amphritea atlantica]SEQ47715.1 5-carboxymethyl-2-hydroxymuconate isomerase [Amphritea atlantica]
MPHCIIEFSETLIPRLPPAKLVQIVYEGALRSGLFEAADIKTRALAYDHFLTGPSPADFIHVTLRILSGRTDEQKQLLSSTVLKGLTDCNLAGISLTVEVEDIHSSSYAKFIA